MSKLIAFFMATGFSFLIFVGMTYLVKPDDMAIQEPEAIPAINFLYKVIDKPPTERDRIPPEPVPPKEPTKIITDSEAETIKPQIEPNLDFPDLDDGVKLGDFARPNLMGGTQGAPGPKVRIHPRYPRDAAIKGIEGYVTLTFDISELGTTKNIRVVDASPKGIFDKAARKALRKWKYSPKMVNEKPVAQAGQVVTLEFRLEEG